MRIVNIYEAKTHFSKLINAVVHGDEIIIAMAGKPIAKLVSIDKKSERQFGVIKGKIKVSKYFDEHLPNNILADFEG
jgi:prevent-host-death family protein